MIIRLKYFTFYLHHTIHTIPFHLSQSNLGWQKRKWIAADNEIVIMKESIEYKQSTTQRWRRHVGKAENAYELSIENLLYRNWHKFCCTITTEETWRCDTLDVYHSMRFVYEKTTRKVSQRIVYYYLAFTFRFVNFIIAEMENELLINRDWRKNYNFLKDLTLLKVNKRIGTKCINIWKGNSQ